MTSSNRVTSGLVVRFALGLVASFAGSTGCGMPNPQEEEIEQSGHALGSTKAQTTINSWSKLTSMVSDGNYKLTVDLNASGKSWTPKTFTGTFDGGGHTISNLNINVTGSGYAGFFSTIHNAIVRDVKLTTLSVKGQALVGGLAGLNEDSTVELVAIEGTITGNGATATGGIFGEMTGGILLTSYAKGEVKSALYYAGGLTGILTAGSSGDRLIQQCFSQMTVSPDTSDASRTVWAGGIAGWTYGAAIREVYAVANVTGRGVVGGIAGAMNCDEIDQFVLNHTIYRGNVTDMNRTPAAGGWAGVVGTYQDCISRFDGNLWDKTLDTSTSYVVHGDAQKGATTQELKTPTSPNSGVYYMRDDQWVTDYWFAGSSNQHHMLIGMPGPAGQPVD